jgi:hypothetical protein
LVLENRLLPGSDLTWLIADRFCVMQRAGLFKHKAANRAELPIPGFSVPSAPSCSTLEQFTN